MPLKPVGIDDDGAFVGRARTWLETQIADAVGAKVVISDTAPPDLPADAVWITTRVDTTPPTVPTGLAAVVTSTGISLTWNPSLDDSGAIGHYTIYRDGVPRTTVTALSYLDTAAVWDTEHDYTVSATDPFGNESAQSAVVSATRGVAGAPLVPDSLSGVALGGHFRASDTLVAEGATVSAIANRVSDGATMTVTGTPAKQTVAGRVGIRCDGTEAIHSATGVIAQPMTRFIAFHLPSVVASKTIMGTTNSAANRQAFAVSSDALAFTLYAGGTIRTIPVTPTATGWIVAVFRVQGATTRYNINGTTGVLASPGTESAEGMRVAANTSGSTLTDMVVGDWGFYVGALADADMDTLAADLNAWY